MNASEILRQLALMQDKLEGWGIKPNGFPTKKHPQDSEQALAYLLHIMSRCRGMVVKGDLTGAIEKIGFMRGVIWATCFATLAELRQWRKQ